MWGMSFEVEKLAWLLLQSACQRITGERDGGRVGSLMRRIGA